MDPGRYYGMLQRLRDYERVPYEELKTYLEVLSKGDLHHARAGFDYWHKAFLAIPAGVKTLDDVERFMGTYMFVDSEYHCSVLNTVNVAMMAFTTALSMRHEELCDSTLHSTPGAALGYALAGSEQLWQELLARVQKRKGITDVDAWCAKLEARYQAKAKEDKDCSRKVNSLGHH